MSKFPPASREDHDTFCVVEDWVLKRGATGQPVKHHRTYTLALWDKRILRTRISRPVDGSQYAASMWAHILREQLEVDAAAFWSCVHDKALPDRGQPSAPKLQNPIPLRLYRELTRLGLSNDEIAVLDAPAAATRYAQLLIDQS